MYKLNISDSESEIIPQKVCVTEGKPICMYSAYPESNTKYMQLHLPVE